MILTITLGLVSFYILTILLNVKKQDIFTFFMLNLFFLSLILMGKVAVEETQTQLLTLNETIVNNTTSYNYGYVTLNYPHNTAITFFKFTQYLYYLFWAVVIVYGSYKFLSYRGLINTTKGLK